MSAFPDDADRAAQEVAQDVFAGDDFWWKRTGDVQSSSWIESTLKWIYEHLIQPVLEAIADFLKWLLEKLFGIKPGAGDWSAGLPFLWLLVALSAAFVIWRLWKILKSRSAAPRSPKPVPVPETVLPQARQLLDEAQECLARGDHRHAIRLAFLSLLAWLQDNGRLRYDPSRSNREYQRDLSRWPDLLSPFRSAAEPFERCWYGGRTLDAGEIEGVLAVCRRLVLESEGAT